MGTLLAIGSAIFTIIGDIFAKEWSLKNKIALFLLTVLFYLIASIIFPLALRHGTLAISNFIAITTVLLVVTAISIFYYHERVNNMQGVGMVLAFIAMILLAFPAKS